MYINHEQIFSHEIKPVANSHISSRKAVLWMVESEVVMATGFSDDATE